jgi:NAD-dependent deacetylase
MSVEIPAELVERLGAAERVVALTGAGVSAESGVPTFRDAQTGLWAKYRAEELATPEAFRKQPKLVWDWYEWRRTLVARAEPNAGHHALGELEQLVPEFSLITQNVDGLHQRAGSQRVIELHGSIFDTLCFDEGTKILTWNDDGSVPPRCPRCAGLLRPGVVWFGELLPEAALASATRAAAESQVLLSIGTSSLVHPAARLPSDAQAAGSLIVEINPAETPLSQRADYVLRGPAGEVLPQLLRHLRETKRAKTLG